MLAVAPPGAGTDIAPTWLVPDATVHSKTEHQRDERVRHRHGPSSEVSTAGGAGAGKRKGKGKGRAREPRAPIRISEQMEMPGRPRGCRCGTMEWKSDIEGVRPWRELTLRSGESRAAGKSFFSHQRVAQKMAPSTAQGWTAIFNSHKPLKMKETENHIFCFHVVKAP